MHSIEAERIPKGDINRLVANSWDERVMHLLKLA